jgi:hypothetical protein
MSGRNSGTCPLVHSAALSEQPRALQEAPLCHISDCCSSNLPALSGSILCLKHAFKSPCAACTTAPSPPCICCSHTWHTSAAYVQVPLNDGFDFSRPTQPVWALVLLGCCGCTACCLIDLDSSTGSWHVHLSLRYCDASSAGASLHACNIVPKLVLCEIGIQNIASWPAPQNHLVYWHGQEVGELETWLSALYHIQDWNVVQMLQCRMFQNL